MTPRGEDTNGPAATPARALAEEPAFTDDSLPVRPTRSGLARVVTTLRRWPSFTVGLVVVVLIVLAAAAAPLISPYDPNLPNFAQVLQGPSWQHLFGTDDLGRDMLTRVIYGARYSLAISSTAVGLATLIGIPLGLFAGYVGGVFDAVVGRVSDALFAFPAVLMAIAIAAMLGPSARSAVIALALIAMPEFSRVARGAMLVEREGTYVEVSRTLGSSWAFIIFRAILPNALGPLLVLISLGFANIVLNEAALTFLGLGAQPPVPEWGAMLSVARRYIVSAPYFALFPGLAICLLVFAFNLVGDGVRDLMDPRQRRRA